MEHYFTNNENLRSELRSMEYSILDTSFVFFTDNGVFSKDKVDYGTNLLLKTYLKYEKNDKTVLDVGCGYGIIGIVISKINNSKVDMIDVNKRSVHLSQMNIEKNNVLCNSFVSNVYECVTKKYDIIISNPPIRAGKKVYHDILLNAREHLNESGTLWFVIRKNQGSKSTGKLLENVYKINLVEKSKGYFVFKAEMR